MQCVSKFSDQQKPSLARVDSPEFAPSCDNVVTTPALESYGVGLSDTIRSPYRAELHKYWWARTVSNRRPLVCKGTGTCAGAFYRVQYIQVSAVSVSDCCRRVHGVRSCLGTMAGHWRTGCSGQATTMGDTVPESCAAAGDYLPPLALSDRQHCRSIDVGGCLQSSAPQ